MLSNTGRPLRISQYYQLPESPGGGADTGSSITAWKKYTPASYAKDFTDLSFVPVEVSRPANLAKDARGNEKLDTAHPVGRKRFLRQAIPMGFAAAKVSLTDLGTRSQIRAELNWVINRAFPDGNVYDIDYPDRAVAVGVTNFRQLCIKLDEAQMEEPPRAPTEQPRSLEEVLENPCPPGYESPRYAALQKALNHVKIPSCPDANLFRISSYPLLRALNGDDNLAVQPASVGEDNQRHLVESGQGIELTKTASSVRYVSYCQTMGYSPLARLVKIILNEVDNPDSAEAKKWWYKPSDKKTYIVNEGIRPRLFTQAFKGSDPTLDQRADVARAGSITHNCMYIEPWQRLLSVCLFQRGFPRGVPKPECFLPEALGGLDYPHFMSPGQDRVHLETSHKTAIHSLLTRATDPSIIARLKTNLRRQEGDRERTNRKINEMDSAIELVETVNESLPKTKQIELFTFEQAKQQALASLSELEPTYSFDASSRISSSISTSLTDAQRDAITSVATDRKLNNKLHTMFTDVGCIMKDLNTKSIIMDIKTGNLRSSNPDRPHRALVHTQRRIKSVMEEVELGEMKPEVENLPTSDFLTSGITDRSLRLFISREDERRLRFENRFSLKVLRGSYRLPIMRSKHLMSGSENRRQVVKAFGQSEALPVLFGTFTEFREGRNLTYGMNELAKPTVRDDGVDQATLVLDKYLSAIQKEEDEEAARLERILDEETSKTSAPSGDEPDPASGSSTSETKKSDENVRIRVHQVQGGPEDDDVAYCELSNVPTAIPAHAKPVKARWSDMMDEDDDLDGAF